MGLDIINFTDMNKSIKKTEVFLLSEFPFLSLGVSVLAACGGGQSGCENGRAIEFPVRSGSYNFQVVRLNNIRQQLRDYRILKSVPQVSGFIVKLCVDEGATTT